MVHGITAWERLFCCMYATGSCITVWPYHCESHASDRRILVTSRTGRSDSATHWAEHYFSPLRPVPHEARRMTALTHVVADASVTVTKLAARTMHRSSERGLGARAKSPPSQHTELGGPCAGGGARAPHADPCLRARTDVQCRCSCTSSRKLCTTRLCPNAHRSPLFCQQLGSVRCHRIGYDSRGSCRAIVPLCRDGFDRDQQRLAESRLRRHLLEP
jgi:hypothetical protein